MIENDARLNNGEEKDATLRILIDICHPAHAHFFQHPIRILRQRGHDLLVTSRVKEMATGLLDDMGIAHRTLTSQPHGSALRLLHELLLRNYRLHRIVRGYQPDVMAAIGGIFISHVGFLSRTPSLVFYDTENARLQNALTYPFASCVYVPECYRGWVPRRRTVRYRGYHELSYLHPKYFKASRDIALANGLAPDGNTFMVRLVSWEANHDIGERGWSAEFLRGAVEGLARHGRVLISSEADLPADFGEYRYSGDERAIHHVMAHCRGYLGESATMASECAVLGVPALYAAATGRGYTDEQEHRFGIVRNLRSLDPAELEAGIRWIMDYSLPKRQHAHEWLLRESIDVAEFVANELERTSSHP